MLPLMRSRISASVSCGVAVEVGGDVAWDAGLDLVEHRHRRADLPRRAIAALEAIVLHEGRLHRMQVAPACQAPRWW